MAQTFDIILLILGFILIIIGIIGSVLPVLPGPTLSWIGLLLVFFHSNIPISYTTIFITGIIAIGINILDYIIPAKSVKKYGGSKYAIWGTNIGLVVGLFFPPLGFLIGPFVGAFLGQMYFNSQDQKTAFKVAIGSFIGFITGTFMKLIICFIYLGMYFYYLIKYL
jgi:uncharacterized protein YqgC (DUF456 family)